MKKDREELVKKINSLPWFHQIDFGNGILSPGRTKIDVLNAQADIYFKDSIKGKTVLDIGCWDGFNSFEAKRRGASKVLATDHFAWSDQCWGNRESFELARTHTGPEVDVMDTDIADLSVENIGLFDFVLFCGVFYHLRHPFHVLEHITRSATETLIVETHMDALNEPRPAMILYPGAELNTDSGNWWGPNRPCVEAMLRDLGFSRVEFYEHPMYQDRGIFRGHR